MLDLLFEKGRALRYGQYVEFHITTRYIIGPLFCTTSSTLVKRL